MTTAAVLIDDALQFIGVSSGIMPAEPDQQQRAFKILQRMYDVLPEKNIYLQLQRPATVAANLREPGYATECLVSILGKMCAPYFQAELTMSHETAYSEAMNLLKRKTGRRPQTQYPGTLPIGSGNYQYGRSDCWHFYAEETQFQYVLFDQQNVGESRIYTADITTEATRRGTTVSTVVWANIGDVSPTISNEGLSGSIATARLTFGTPGNAIVRARVTFANSEVYDWILKVQIVDPEHTYSADS